MISKGSTPDLTLVTKGTVDVDYPREEYYMPSLPKKEKPKVNGKYIIMYAAHVLHDSVMCCCRNN